MKIIITGLFFVLCLSCAAARPRRGTVVVTANPTNGGTTYGSGTYPGKTQVEIHVVPNSGWMFTQWQDGFTNPTRTVTVPNGGTVRYTASFVAYGNVALSAEPINGGTVTGAGAYPVGKAVDITAKPFDNWSFTRWQDNNTANPRTVLVPSGSILFTATFVTNVPPPQVFTNGSFVLQYSPVTNVFNYIASWGVTSRSYTNSILTNATSLRIVGLITNQVYYFAVQAMGADGKYSPFSCEVHGLCGLSETNYCSP